MIQLQENERRHLIAWMSQGELVQNALDNVITRTGNRQWDGMIHSSKLDWDKDVQKQFDAHLKNYSFSSSYTRAGDLYHEDIQRVLDTFFSPGLEEYRFHFPELHLQGTVDRIQYIDGIGWVLMEFKTTSELGRDKSGGDRILNKLLKDKHLKDNLIVSKAWGEHEDEILKRLRICERDNKPKSNHLTQMFTYCWALSSTMQLDYACLIYIARDSYKILSENWYKLSDNQSRIVRAYDNFMGVRECLLNYLNEQ